MRYLILLFALLPALASAQVSFGTATLIDNDWEFNLEDEPRASAVDFNDRAWKQVDLPHDWSIAGQPSKNLASCTGYLPGGIGWYRKTLRLSSEKGAEKVFLYFEGVYNRSEVYINGHLLGKRPNGFVSFIYDATPFVKYDQDNVVAVRVDHSRSADSRWYTGSGIYRDVFLVRAGREHIEPFGVVLQPQIDKDEHAQIRVETEVRNESSESVDLTLRQEVVAVDDAVVASATTTLTIAGNQLSKTAVNIPIEQGHRWSLEDPYLYRVRTTLLREGKPIDQAVTRTGLRAFTFDPDLGFFINGKSTKLKGVCIHDDAGVLGTAVPREVWKQRLENLKSIGCNAVRMSHNPHAPEFYDLCDELGLLVLDEAFDEWEFPKRKWLRGWNLGEPGFEGSSDYFTEWSDRDVADMVRRDRNHASIFAWSIGNEVDYPNDPYSHPVLDQARINQPMLPGYKPDHPDAKRLGVIARRLVGDVKKEDRSRPVTAALAGVVMSNETDYPGLLDVVGYNYTEDRYARDHQKYPQRIIYGSENGHSLQAWKAVVENKYISGQFLWTGIDYLGEAGAWPARGATSGLLDLTGAVKPRGRFREALWSDKPAVYLGTELASTPDQRSIDAWPIWNYLTGEKVRVLCYMNAASVKLLLDGEPLGSPKPADQVTGVVAWELPFRPGKLEALAFDTSGREVARTSLTTATAPSALKLAVNVSDISRDRGLAIISLQVVDQHGIAAVTDNTAVSCRVDGPARLLGLEAGDIRDMSAASSATRHLYHGRLVAYVQSSGTAGTVHVRFSRENLPETSITLNVK